MVFAKGALARWCSLNGVEFVGFETLAEVREALQL